MKRSLQLVALIALLSLSIPAAACRYSVREVGFVNLDEAPYRFYGVVDESAAPGTAALFKRIAYTELLDANIEIEIVDRAATPTHLAFEHLPPETPLPAGVLVSPEGQTRIIPLLVENFEAVAAPALEALVVSPVRTAIQTDMIESFAVVLLVHGDTPAANDAARKVTQAAIDEITANQNQLDKPVDEAAKLVELPADAREAEAALLWSLDIDPASLSAPRIVVLFGKARRMGGVLRGDKVTQNELVRVLALVGTSCECGLDRKWMQGTMLPMRWGSELDAALAAHLGFDPESPMVKTEISQIIALGARNQGVNSNFNALLGYRETGAQQAAAAAGSLAPENAAPAGDTPYIEDVPLDDAAPMPVPVPMPAVALPKAVPIDGVVPKLAPETPPALPPGMPDPHLALQTGEAPALVHSWLPVYVVAVVALLNAAVVTFIVLRARKLRS
ncbi:MAG: hypothetical protein HYV27_02590 [Candidatus Hydrogenedentes bacterium]|nr:hypothetical protein [Candidatus Hydrogenedentota bacterium]